MVEELETARLRLLPYAPEHLRALMAGYEEYAASFGHRAELTLRDFYLSGDVSPGCLQQLAGSTAADIWIHGFAVLLRASDSLIGSSGFKGSAGDDGVVEIAYGIVAVHQ